MIRFTEPIRKTTAPKFPPLTETERAIAAALLAAVKRIRDQYVAADVVRALQAHDIEGAIEAVRFGLGEEFLQSILPAHLRVAYEATAAATVAAAGRQFGIRYGFDILSAGAVQWVRDNAASLIEQWGKSSRDAVRDLIVRGFQETTPYGTLARQIRDTAIGITRQQQKWLDRFRARLEAEGVSATKIEARTARYYRQLLKLRSEMIARTEMTRAMDAARREAWRQARDKGLLDDRRMEKEWLATNDARCCEACSDLDGTRAEVPDGEFVSETGEEGGLGPPRHVQCRCRSVLVPKGSGKMPRAQVNIPGDLGIRPGIRR